MGLIPNIKFDVFCQNPPTNILENQNQIGPDIIAALPKGGDKKQSAEKEVARIAREVVHGKTEINFSGKTYSVTQCFYINSKLNSFLQQSDSCDILTGLKSRASYRMRELPASLS